MASQIATAYVAVVPTMKGVQRQLVEQLSPQATEAARAAGRRAGKSLGSELGSAARGTTRAFVDLGRDISKSLAPATSKIGDQFRQGFRSAIGHADEARGAIGKLGAATAKLSQPASMVASQFRQGFRGAEKSAAALNTSVGGVSHAVGDLARKAITPGNNFTQGFKSSAAAASSFTGTMGTMGGRFRALADRAALPGKQFATGIKGTEGASKSFMGRMGGMTKSIGTMATGAVGAFRGFGSSVSSSLNGVTEKISSMSHGFSNLAGTAVKVGATIAGAIAGIAVGGGIKRALDIEDAQAKLKGLGHSTGTVEGIMKNALASVKGTAYGLGEAASTAASAVASGIKPGGELEQVLKTVANSASIAGVDMSHMGTIFNSVAARGKLQGDDLLQLVSAGVPVLQFLAKETGKTSAEISDMVSKGQIDFATFERAMRAGVGDAAVAMGQTTRGQIKNLMAALSRAGEAAVSVVLPAFKRLLSFATTLADGVASKIKPVAETIRLFGESFQGPEQRMALLKNLVSENGEVLGAWVGRIMTARDSLAALASGFTSSSDEITSSGIPGAFERIGIGARLAADKVKEFIGAIPPEVWAVISVAASAMAATLVSMLPGIGAVGSALGAIGGVVLKLAGSLGFMGGPVGLVVSLLAAAVASSEPLRESLAELGKTVLTVAGTALTTLAEAFSGLAGPGGIMEVAQGAFSGLVGVVAEVLIGVIPIVSGVLEKVVPLITDLAVQILPPLMTAFSDLAATILGAFTSIASSGLIDTLVSLVGSLADVFTSVLAAVLPVVATLVSTLVPVILDLVEALLPPFLSIVGLLAGVFATLAPVVAKLVAVLVEALAPILAVLVEVVAKVAEVLIGALAVAITWIAENVLPVLLDGLAWLGQKFVELGPVMLDLWDWVKEKVSGFATWFMETLVPAIKDAVTWLSEAFTWLNDTIVQPVWTAIKTAIAVAAAVVLTIFDGIKWAIDNILAPVFTWLYENIIKPVWNGIKLFIGVAWNGIKVIWNAIKWTIDNILAPVFTWLYNNIIKPVWNGIKWVIGNAWNGIKVIWDALKQGAQWIADKFQWLKDRAAAIWAALKNSLAWVWGQIRDRVFAPIKQGAQWVADKFGNVKAQVSEKWRQLKDSLASGWDAIRSRVFDPMKRGVQSVQDTFRDVKNGIGRVWADLKKKVSDPVKVVINTVVNDGFISNFNKIAAKLPGVKELPTVNFKGLARGGILPGSSSWRNGDDQLVPMRRGEGVSMSEVVRDPYERARLYHMNNAVRSGMTPERARETFDGKLKDRNGIPGHDPNAAVGARVFNGVGGGSFTNPLQHAIARTGVLKVSGLAPGWDLGRAMGMWNGAAGVKVKSGGIGANHVSVKAGPRSDWWAGYYENNSIRLNSNAISGKQGRRTVAAHELGHALGLPHSMGWGKQSIMDYGSMYKVNAPTTADIRELQKIYPGGTGMPGEGSAGLFSGMFEKFTKLVNLSSLLGKIPGGGFVADVMKGAATQMWEGIKSLASKVFSDDEESPAGEGAERWRSTIKRALEHVGLPSTSAYVDAWLRQVATESGGNEKARQGIIDVNSGGNEAAGLLQVTRNTWNAYRDQSLVNDRLNGFANAVAGMRWAKSRYGVEGMLGVIGHGHGYARGGVVGEVAGRVGDRARNRVWDAPIGSVHELDPGYSTVYNGTGGSEYFARVDRVERREDGDDGATNYNFGEVHGFTPDEVAEAIERRARQRRALAR